MAYYAQASNNETIGHQIEFENCRATPAKEGDGDISIWYVIQFFAFVIWPVPADACTEMSSQFHYKC